jgi:hypothetical protein
VRERRGSYNGFCCRLYPFICWIIIKEGPGNFSGGRSPHWVNHVNLCLSCIVCLLCFCFYICFILLLRGPVFLTYTAEEHIEAFYAYAENINISEEDLWTRVFIQSLDGQARKWFKELPTNSITDIEQLDAAFLKHWGERRDLLYYISEFGNLKRGDGESVLDFIKRFKNMFGKIPVEIKPSDASAKITFYAAFDAEFCLIFRERRAAMLAFMQDVALEVESNITASQQLKGRTEKKKAVVEPSSSSNSKMEKMAKMLESLTSEMSKLKVQNQQPARTKEPNTFSPRNPNDFPYRRNNPPVQILQRDRNLAEEQRIRPPLQNAVLDEEQHPPIDEIEDADEINYFGDENESSFLTQVDYEEALMDHQIQEAGVGKLST